MTKSSKEKTFIIKILLRKNQDNTKNILSLKWFMQLDLRKNNFQVKSQKKRGGRRKNPLSRKRKML